MSDEKVSMMDIAREVETIFIREGLTAKEVLMVLREIETEATLALAVEHIVKAEPADKQ